MPRAKNTQLQNSRKQSSNNQEEDFSIENWTPQDVQELVLELNHKPKTQSFDYENSDYNNWNF